MERKLKITNESQMIKLGEEIGKNAFESCKVLKTVVIKEGVEVIKQGAFKDCYCLECVKLPDSITLVDVIVPFIIPNKV